MKSAGHAVWLSEFTPAGLDHLGFLNSLVYTFCELDICCVYSTGGNVGILLYISRTDSPILDNIYNKVPSFQIGPFTFSLTALEQFVNYRDYSMFNITQGAETVQLLIGVVDSVTCGTNSSINLLELLWDTTVLFAFQMHGIVCVPFDSPKVLYLRQYGTSSGGWTQTSLCLPCFKDYRPSTKTFLPTCTG